MDAHPIKPQVYIILALFGYIFYKSRKGYILNPPLSFKIGESIFAWLLISWFVFDFGGVLRHNLTRIFGKPINGVVIETAPSVTGILPHTFILGEFTIEGQTDRVAIPYGASKSILVPGQTITAHIWAGTESGWLALDDDAGYSLQRLGIIIGSFIVGAAIFLSEIRRKYAVNKQANELEWPGR